MKFVVVLGLLAAPGLLGGCTQNRMGGTFSMSAGNLKHYSAQDKECLARAMFFESKRSSREGLVAVGTVVMNRLDSGRYGSSVCEVVGQKGQFAPGVLTRPMNSAALPDVESAADAVMRGERHPKIKEAMFFHTAGLRFPYKNMHYVLVAGGNAFYEKRTRQRLLDPTITPEVQVASAGTLGRPPVPAMPSPAPQGVAKPVMVASAEPLRQTLDPETGDAASGLTTLSYDQPSPAAADAIGALIASTDRPLE